METAPGNNNEPIKAIIADFQKRSMPVDGRWLRRPEPEFGNWSVDAVWEIETREDWNEFSIWIGQRFRDFKTKDSIDGKILLLKQLHGDTLRLLIEKIGESPLRVRVSFRGYPS